MRYQMKNSITRKAKRKHSRLLLAVSSLLNDIKYLNYLKKRLVHVQRAPYGNVSLICLTLIKLDLNLADKLREHRQSLA